MYRSQKFYKYSIDTVWYYDKYFVIISTERKMKDERWKMKDERWKMFRSQKFYKYSIDTVWCYDKER